MSLKPKEFTGIGILKAINQLKQKSVILLNSVIVQHPTLQNQFGGEQTTKQECHITLPN